jgi:putative SOS response-associated peptidase YedK
MCNRYVAPAQGDIERHWHLGAQQPMGRWAPGVYPRAPGPFIRAHQSQPGQRELVVGQWALVPHFAKTPKLSYQTNNARSEELAQKASYRGPWQRGQRCVIPAWVFDEPCWETGRNVWWSFKRADGQPWGLAGLWNTWVDPATGEVVESYTMLTLNADAHPLMRRMHKPDPQLGPDQQDKRSVIPIELEDVDAWLHGSQQHATALLRLAPVEVFSAMPAPADPAGAASAPGGSAPPAQPSLL